MNLKNKAMNWIKKHSARITIAYVFAFLLTMLTAAIFWGIVGEMLNYWILGGIFAGSGAIISGVIIYYHNKL